MARMLVIDDEASLRDTLARMLQREGHEVLTAADGVEGFRCWREHGAAVVILDIFALGTGGDEAAG
jgi:two-component system response regulator RegX3